MQAMQEQMQRPEVQEQMKEAQALMQDKGFAEKVEKLKVSWLAADTGHVACMLRAQCPCYINVFTSSYPVCMTHWCLNLTAVFGQIVHYPDLSATPCLKVTLTCYIDALLTNLCYRKTLS